MCPAQTNWMTCPECGGAGTILVRNLDSPRQAVIEAAKAFQLARYAKGVTRDEYKVAEEEFSRSVDDLLEIEKGESVSQTVPPSGARFAVGDTVRIKHGSMKGVITAMDRGVWVKWPDNSEAANGFGMGLYFLCELEKGEE